MGIDVYMEWKDQTKEDKDMQCTWFSVVDGHVGYLREAYHGGPYVTKFLVPEAFESGKAAIEAQVLRERLPHALKLAKERNKAVYKQESDDGDPVIKAFSDFVELAERKEKLTGEPVVIRVSA